MAVTAVIIPAVVAMLPVALVMLALVMPGRRPGRAIDRRRHDPRRRIDHHRSRCDIHRSGIAGPDHDAGTLHAERPVHIPRLCPGCTQGCNITVDTPSNFSRYVDSSLPPMLVALDDTTAEGVVGTGQPIVMRDGPLRGHLVLSIPRF